MKLTKKSIYIGLFGVLYLIVAFSSFWHACAFFGLANTSWMSIILAFAFEVGQAAVLFSLLTSEKDRGRIMPWVLMTMFTLVQVVGNVFSSYKYIITNSVENLRYFKEPIFIWTTLPDDQATVIVTYVVGAILPVAALLLTSMITNYLSDQEELNKLENDKETFKTQEAPQEEYKKEKSDEGVINNEETPKESIKEEPVEGDPEKVMVPEEEDPEKVMVPETEESEDKDPEKVMVPETEESEDEEPEKVMVPKDKEPEKEDELEDKDPEKVMVPEDEEPEKVKVPVEEDSAKSNELKSHFVNI